ncbi:MULTISPECIES: hypothetical protein [unclassified Coleofasciculus]|uniref:hypothetical protein n=1 Tax=unclassified Coleofasciculus TaxID=2692782 RepID=UPI001881E23A|nr:MULTISPECIES: hypothetical protein [unclassified Coleofasciculus]MBE9129683.1 hypothetical protein [Coleofasciculus sp. LEGE 07081]MBE9152188.1 hypothetical protein [Coleofasciculus sp. LEGE 07092]
MGNLTLVFAELSLHTIVRGVSMPFFDFLLLDKINLCQCFCRFLTIYQLSAWLLPNRYWLLQSFGFTTQHLQVTMGHQLVWLGTLLLCLKPIGKLMGLLDTINVIS